jgi:hypothetical protein
MIALVAAIFFTVATVALAAAVAERGDRARLVGMVALAWVVLAPLTAALNGPFRFAGGGDDETYFRLGASPVASLADLLDPTRFSGVVDQPGYPWLLSVLSQISGGDLLTFKLLNLFAFTALALVVYRIGVALEGAAFGRLAAAAVLVLTPLWYYVFFLLKDMTITLLLALFLLGVVEQIRRNSLAAGLLIGSIMLILVPLRSALVLQCAAVWLGALMLRSASSRKGGGVLAQVAGWGVVAGILTIASSREIMESLGVFTPHRVVGSAEMFGTAVARYQETRLGWASFLFTYLLSETSGLSLPTWERWDSFWLRGVLALPWIFVVLPFFLVGLVFLLGSSSREGRRRGLLGRLRDSRLIATPWGALVLFVASSMAVSWSVGDTTRYRIPDMPVIGAIAAAGWWGGPPQRRLVVLGAWMAASGVLFSIYYMLRLM